MTGQEISRPVLRAEKLRVVHEIRAMVRPYLRWKLSSTGQKAFLEPAVYRDLRGYGVNRVYGFTRIGLITEMSPGSVQVVKFSGLCLEDLWLARDYVVRSVNRIRRLAGEVMA